MNPAPRRPLIAIVDWIRSPQGDEESSIEKSIIGDAAEVRRFLCEDDSDFDDGLCQADALIVWHNATIGAEGLTRLARCRALIRNGVGYDSIDIEAAARLGIAVCNVPDYGTEEVADHALALTLALCRQVLPLDQEAKRLGWQIPPSLGIHRLRGRVFGIVGLGRIGTATALRAKAFGFRVVFFDPYLPNGVEKALGIERSHSLDALLDISDVLSIHCPLREDTKHLIDDKEIARMKPSSFLVNTARGAIVKKTTILSALREGRLAGAGLDVVEDEPLQSMEEAHTPNLITTCHSAFFSHESKIEMRSSSARIALAAVTGGVLENVVNQVERH